MIEIQLDEAVKNLLQKKAIREGLIKEQLDKLQKINKNGIIYQIVKYLVIKGIKAMIKRLQDEIKMIDNSVIQAVTDELKVSEKIIERNRLLMELQKGGNKSNMDS